MDKAQLRVEKGTWRFFGMYSNVELMFIPVLIRVSAIFEIFTVESGQLSLHLMISYLQSNSTQ